MKLKSRHLLSVMCIALFSLNAPAEENKDKDNLLDNGSFTEEGPMSGAIAWSRGNPAFISFVAETIMEKGEEVVNRYCRITLEEPQAAIILQKLDVSPEWKTLDVSVRIRAKDVVTGDEAWKTGQFQFLFLDEAGKVVGGWNRLKVTEDTDGWVTMTKKGVKVPATAKALKCQVGVWGAKGTFEFDDVSVKVAETQLP